MPRKTPQKEVTRINGTLLQHRLGRAALSDGSDAFSLLETRSHSALDSKTKIAILALLSRGWSLGLYGWPYDENDRPLFDGWRWVGTANPQVREDAPVKIPRELIVILDYNGLLDFQAKPFIRYRLSAKGRSAWNSLPDTVRNDANIAADQLLLIHDAWRLYRERAEEFAERREAGHA